MRYLPLFVLVMMTYGCLPPSDPAVGEVSLDYSDESQQRILNLQDERRTDLLMDYFDSPYPTERYLVASAMASIQDSTAVDKLLQLLTDDPNEEVRQKAAYALGQIGDEASAGALIAAFARQDSSNVNSPVRAAILEAVGKCGSARSLDDIATVSTYGVNDDQLLLGQTRAIYRYGLRGITSEKSTKRAVDLAIDARTPAKARQMAAAYLGRMRSVDFSAYLDTLAAVVPTISDPYVSMNMVSAIGRGARVEDLPVLLDLLSKASTDYRVKVNILRSLSTYPYRSYRDAVAAMIVDENDAVRLTAASTLANNAPAEQARYLVTQSIRGTDDRVKATLLGGVLKAAPFYLANTRKRASDAAINGLKSAQSPYTKNMYLRALSHDPLNYQSIIDLGANSDHVATRSTIASILPALLTTEKYTQIFRTTAVRSQVEQAIAGAMKTIFESDDEGAMAAGASALRYNDSAISGDPTLKSTIREALSKLELPKEIETKKELEQTLAKWDSTEYVEPKLGYNHPIDWSVLSEINDSSRVYVITTKGQIELELYQHEAPGSVANFLKLATDNFYDGNVIHRVAPNFVVQAGCPRGDGYGALDYSIRSEFGPIYYEDAGYLGMASAGKDTEATQWFITHSPTPHLDGRYTIFGKVTSGMDVVHKLQIGDSIVDIRVLRDGSL